MKNQYAIFLAVGAIVLGACSAGSPPTSAPTNAPTASTATAQSAAPTTQQPSDTKVAAVTTGPHPYFTIWGTAVADAQKDYGLAGSVFKFPPTWDFNLENSVIETLVAQGYNAFVVFPGDPTGENATYSELAAKGIPSVSGAGCTLDPATDKLCFSTDVKLSAYNGTKAVIEAMGGHGNLVHLAGLLSVSNTKLRMEGVQQAVDETNGAVTLLQTITETDDMNNGEKLISALLAARESEIDGIIGTGYDQSLITAKHLTAIGDKRIKLVGIDDDPIVLQAIKDGFMVGTMSQNPYLQAYVGAYALDLFRRGCTAKPTTPHLIDSGSGLLTANDLTNYKQQLQDDTKEFVKTFKDTYMDCPAGV